MNATGMQVRCVLENIKLTREHGFKLSIPKLEIGTEEAFTKEGRAVIKLPLVGKSGAGKSTLLNMMAGIEWPDEGRVSWWFPDGTTFSWGSKGLSASEAGVLRRKYFGFAFQNSTLVPHLRVCDNLCYPLILRGDSPSNARKKARKMLHDVLHTDEKHTDELFQRFPSKLSGGQLQRVALVQSFIHDPRVLFADEPTGSLDRDTRKQVMTMLLEWVEHAEPAGQRLLLWVTHHYNDPRDANVQWKLVVEAGGCSWNGHIRDEREGDQAQ
jgi:ABC-type lipoprotein export system ATPase subunit